MANVETEPKPIISGLKSFYDWAIPFSWVVVRFAVGWNLLIHGWQKIERGTAVYVKGFVAVGYEPAMLWIWSALFIEFVGGIAIIIGLFTRFFAAAAAIEMLLIMFIYWKNGFAWTARGYEYVLLWGLVCAAIALRGGGPYSVDRKLGREL
jgi:putative oxidoreductase